MRTTLTLDDDVAAVLERLRKSRSASLRDLVNEALRRGLKDMSSRTKRRECLRTRSVALGRLRIAGQNVGANCYLPLPVHPIDRGRPRRGLDRDQLIQ